MLLQRCVLSFDSFRYVEFGEEAALICVLFMLLRCVLHLLKFFPTDTMVELPFAHLPRSKAPFK